MQNRPKISQIMVVMYFVPISLEEKITKLKTFKLRAFFFK